MTNRTSGSCVAIALYRVNASAHAAHQEYDTTATVNRDGSDASDSLMRVSISLRTSPSGTGAFAQSWRSVFSASRAGYWMLGESNCAVNASWLLLRARSISPHV